jgi:hypothetical protein
MGRISAVFKADEAETAGRYSIWECPDRVVRVGARGRHPRLENRGDTRARVLNISAPGDFEAHMPAIAEWFTEHPPGNAG